MVLSTTEKDFLEQDPVIRGQSFACVSFISPEEIIKNKETFYFENYIQHFSKQINELFVGIEDMYLDKKDQIRSIKEQYQVIFNTDKVNEDFKTFVTNNDQVLDKEFNEKYDFQTNVRGIKIRGVYESMNEAQLRCEHLRKLDNNKFSIYVCEVGCWCPWSPNPDAIKNQEYAVDSLNTLMHEYEKNNQSKDEHYAQRKSEMKTLIEESEKKKKSLIEEEKDKADILADTLDNTSIEDIKKSIEDNVPITRTTEPEAATTEPEAATTEPEAATTEPEAATV
jgi:hypothetical protein